MAPSMATYLRAQDMWALRVRARLRLGMLECTQEVVGRRQQVPWRQRLCPLCLADGVPRAVTEPEDTVHLLLRCSRWHPQRMRLRRTMEACSQATVAEVLKRAWERRDERLLIQVILDGRPPAMPDGYCPVRQPRGHRVDYVRRRQQLRQP